MFKQVYAAVAVTVQTAFISIIGFYGLQQLWAWLQRVNWSLVGVVFVATILLAIIIDLCYNYFCRYRETMTHALYWLWQDIKSVFATIGRLFTSRFKTTLGVIITTLAAICFTIGLSIIYQKLEDIADKATNFDNKVIAIKSQYQSRLDNVVDQLEQVKRDISDKDALIDSLRGDVERLKDVNLALENKVKVMYSKGDTKNSRSRRSSR